MRPETLRSHVALADFTIGHFILNSPAEEDGLEGAAPAPAEEDEEDDEEDDDDDDDDAWGGSFRAEDRALDEDEDRSAPRWDRRAGRPPPRPDGMET